MLDTEFSPEDIAKAQQVADAITGECAPAQHSAMMRFCSDPGLNPIALPLGMAKHHINALAVALGTLAPALRDRLIDKVPQHLRDVIAREEG